jgi:hypothetical protein
MRNIPGLITGVTAKLPTSRPSQQGSMPVESGSTLPNQKAKGKSAAPKGNKTEVVYAVHLETLKRAGLVLWYRFEAVKLRLADNTFYTPDFAVMLPDGEIELHEVKGFWRDDARVKIKVAAEMYPFQFVAVQKAKGGEWKIERF